MTEAMACGTPVVAWRNGSVPEVVDDGETGFIVDSVEEMATAVDRVGELDPLTMRARVEQQFSADAMIAGYEDIYRHVLAHEDGQVGPHALNDCRPGEHRAGHAGSVPEICQLDLYRLCRSGICRCDAEALLR